MKLTLFSEFYIDSEEKKEKSAVQVLFPDQHGDPDDFTPFPPPPPEKFKEEQVYSNGMATMQRLTNIEEHLSDIKHRVSDCVIQDTVINMLQKPEDKIIYRIQKETDRIKLQMDSKFTDLGQSMVDCLKRSDLQQDQRIQALNPLSSTPMSAKMVSHHKTAQTEINQIQAAHSSQQCLSLPTIPAPYNPPLKLEFPSFTNASIDDPVVFIERVEEYISLRPSPDKELLASLAVVMKGTAKDWWSAERKNIATWKIFKNKFLFAFLNEDFREVAAQRLQNKESIRDFAYHYRTLCMRNKPDMTEEEIVHAKSFQNLQLSVTINHTNFNAIIDTGSTFSIVQQKIWKKLSRKGTDQFSASNQNFILANG